MRSWSVAVSGPGLSHTEPGTPKRPKSCTSAARRTSVASAGGSCSIGGRGRHEVGGAATVARRSTGNAGRRSRRSLRDPGRARRRSARAARSGSASSDLVERCRRRSPRTARPGRCTRRRRSAGSKCVPLTGPDHLDRLVDAADAVEHLARFGDVRDPRRERQRVAREVGGHALPVPTRVRLLDAGADVGVAVRGGRRARRRPSSGWPSVRRRCRPPPAMSLRGLAHAIDR